MAKTAATRNNSNTKAPEDSEKRIDALLKRATLAVGIASAGIGLIAIGVTILGWFVNQWLSQSAKQLDEIRAQGKEIAAMSGVVESMKDTVRKQQDVADSLRNEISSLASKTGLIDTIHAEAKDANKTASQIAADTKAVTIAVEAARKDIEKLQLSVAQAELKLAPLKDIGKDVAETRNLATNLTQRPSVPPRQVARIPLRISGGKTSENVVGKFTVTDISIPLADVPVLSKAEIARSLEIMSVELRSKSLGDDALTKLSVVPVVNERDEKLVLSVWCLTGEKPPKLESDLQAVLVVSWLAP